MKKDEKNISQKVLRDLKIKPDYFSNAFLEIAEKYNLA